MTLFVFIELPTDKNWWPVEIFPIPAEELEQLIVHRYSSLKPVVRQLLGEFKHAFFLGASFASLWLMVEFV